MKKIILVAIIALMSFSAQLQAQTKTVATDDEVALIQKLFGEEKLNIVTYYVKPGKEHMEAFEKLYNEYEVERKVLGKRAFELLNQYAEKWEGMSNDQADAWMKEVLDVSAKREKLIRTYYKKIKKATTPLIATQFFQVETYINTAIKYAIYETIPFVGEGK